jgi:hypothetical protein
MGKKRMTPVLALCGTEEQDGAGERKTASEEKDNAMTREEVDFFGVCGEG